MAPSLPFWIGGGIVLLAGFVWFVADVRHLLVLGKRQQELDHQGRWEELNERYERARPWHHPFAALLLRALAPGAEEGMHASHLFSQGRLDEALARNERALRKAASRPPLLSPLLCLQAQILGGLGRYEEARASLRRALEIPAGAALAHLIAGITDLYEGKLDEASGRAEQARREPTLSDAACSLLSSVRTLQGRTRDAIEALLMPASDHDRFFSERQLSDLRQTPEGREYLKAGKELWEGVMKPARFLAAAQAYLDADDAEGVRYTLERARELIGGNPSLLRTYHQLRACGRAAAGDPAGRDAALGEARRIVERFPGRCARYEFHFHAARARLAAGEAAAAFLEARSALEIALHPVERHSARYWQGRAEELAGKAAEARASFEAVARDPFETWMSRDAARRIPAAPS